MGSEDTPVNPPAPTGVPRRAFLAGALGSVAVATVGCSSSPDTSTARPSPTRQGGPRFAGDPGPGQVYLGVSLSIDEPASAETDFGGEDITLARRFYRAHQTELMKQVVPGDVAQGALPLVSFKVVGSWRSLADGRHDQWLDEILEALDSLHAPAMVALHHEPENDVDDGDNTPATWVAMQQRMIKRAASLKQVTPVPVLMNWTFQARSQRDPREWLVPEAALMGVDVYNPWQPGSGADWVEFADMYDLIAQVVTDQPLIVPEFGSTADPFDPTRAALWMRGAFDTAVREGVVGLAWFDARLKSVRDRRIDEAGRREMRELLTRPEVARLSPR
jgi:hypothetical protein